MKNVLIKLSDFQETELERSMQIYRESSKNLLGVPQKITPTEFCRQMMLYGMETMREKVKPTLSKEVRKKYWQD